VDESYFGGVRKGKRGRGAAGKVPVFGLLKRGGSVYAKVIPDTKSKMELKIFGTRPRDICVDLTVFPSSIFLYF
jgi:transposase